jgi:membrane protease YdiL (CAAX protease family)
MISRTELNKSPFLQFILLLCLCLISVVVFSIIGGVLAAAIYGFNPSNINNLGDPSIIEGMKLFQLFSAIGLFIVPPLVYGLLVSKNLFEALGLNSFSKPASFFLVALLMVVVTPFLSWVIELNASMILPDFLSSIEEWMKASESKAESLTKAFLTFDGLGSLIYIMIIVAVIPAIGEELLFRGVLQKIMTRWVKNPHTGIWITAFLFSALHMQFFGFFPRMLLGALFGYLFLWSKSLWLPILGHFINNGTVVLASYFYPEMIENTDVTVFGEGNESIVTYLLSFVFASAILFLIWKINTKKKTEKLYIAPDSASQQ